MAANVDLIIEQGATFSYTVTARSDGAYLDLTGYSARMKIRKSSESATVLLSLVSPSASGTGLDLGGAAGTVEIKISAASTAALDFYVARYDLEIVSAGGVVTRLLEGRVTLNREITK